MWAGTVPELSLGSCALHGARTQHISGDLSFTSDCTLAHEGSVPRAPQSHRHLRQHEGILFYDLKDRSSLPMCPCCLLLFLLTRVATCPGLPGTVTVDASSPSDIVQRTFFHFQRCSSLDDKLSGSSTFHPPPALFPQVSLEKANFFRAWPFFTW